MPQNSSTAILKRWMALDRELMPIGSGLVSWEFARRHKVSTKTVRRDLAAFRELGYPASLRRLGNQYWWWYEPGVTWMFSANRMKPERDSEGRPTGVWIRAET